MTTFNFTNAKIKNQKITTVDQESYEKKVANESVDPSHVRVQPAMSQALKEIHIDVSKKAGFQISFPVFIRGILHQYILEYFNQNKFASVQGCEHRQNENEEVSTNG